MSKALIITRTLPSKNFYRNVNICKNFHQVGDSDQKATHI